MDKEKLFYFLDIVDTKYLNKSSMKVFCAFDVFFSAIIVCIGLLFNYISFSVFDIVCITAIFMTAILFVAMCKFISKPIVIIPYTFAILSITTLKLLYGYWIFANNESHEYGYPLFSWVHITCLIIALSFFSLFVCSQIKLYEDIKKMTFQELINREKNTKIKAAGIVKAHPWILVSPIVFSSPYAISKLLKRWEVFNGLGVGFGMWMLASCWLIFLSLYLPKFIVYIKHRKLLEDII